MKYYSITNSLNNKIVGHYNQVINAIHNCDIWENPKFIDRIDFFKIDFEPITSNAILEKKAKLTDLINTSCVGFGLRLLISDQLKNILESHSKERCQFFKSAVIYKNEKIDNYWITQPYTFNRDYINFNKSIVSVSIRKPEGGTEKKLLQINSSDDFIKTVNFYKEREEIVSINNIFLNDNINDAFFILRYVEGGIKYIVSEKLKKEIEDAGCTGIEFQPIEFSINEWLQGGEREKVYGKV
jgi:hypothetical protein